MSEHPNTVLLRRGHEAFSSGDMDTLSELIAEDTVWHWPGKNQISGEYKGRAAVFENFAKMAELTGGNIKLVDIDILSTDKNTVALSKVVATRGDKTFDYKFCEVVQWRNGQIEEEWIFLNDQYAYDKFWS